MTGPEDGASSTRPISVAELLAKNGTIGAAPPGGGRRRRRRGNSDAVTVAELTGEIPIYRTGAIPIVESEPDVDADVVAPEPVPEAAEPAADVAPQPPVAEGVREAIRGNGSNGSAPTSVAKTSSRPELSDQPIPRRGRDTALERSDYPRPGRFPRTEAVAGAELMSPDPVAELTATDVDAEALDPDALDPQLGLELDTAGEVEDTDVDEDAQPDELGIGDASYLQSYLRSTSGPLYSGQTVADDLARGGSEDADLLVDLGDDDDVAEALEVHDDDDVEVFDDAEQLSKGQLVLRGCWVALQSIIAVVFGAGLFIAFDQLWKWNNIVALVLSVLVILGLVVGVRVVRKTEDIASTLIAVAVGALVTLGPLALLQSN